MAKRLLIGVEVLLFSISFFSLFVLLIPSTYSERPKQSRYPIETVLLSDQTQKIAMSLLGIALIIAFGLMLVRCVLHFATHARDVPKTLDLSPDDSSTSTKTLWNRE